MSYRTILAVINEHTGSTVAAHYAMALAVSGECRLVLYCAHEERDGTLVSLTVDRHQGEYGPNEIREMHARSLASLLAAQFTHFLLLLAADETRKWYVRRAVS